MTSAEGSGPGLGPVERKPLATPEEIRKAFWEPSQARGTGRAPTLAHRLPEVSSTSGIMEFGLAVTGVGLSVFILMHMTFLATILLGAETFDKLALLFERYYLLQSAAPILIVAIVVHAILALHRVPVSFRQQRLLLSRIGAMRHFDTFAWGVQLVSAAAIVALVSIHLGHVLTDAPIEAAKSGARVRSDYLWFDFPFVAAVYSHMFAGLYRVCVKWGVGHRRLLRAVLVALTLIAFGTAAAITVALYRVGGGA